MIEQGPSRRVQRVEKEIREIVSKYIVTEVPEVETILSVSRVIVSRDLRKAKVFIHSLDGLAAAKKDVEILKTYSPDIQKEIAHQIRMRYCPKIEFYVDEKYEEVLKVQNLLEQIRREREEQVESKVQ